MADTVTTTTIFPEMKIGTSTNKSKKQIMQFTNVSDGTGESAVTKIDISTLIGPSGASCTKIAIEEIDYSVFGMSVYIYADQTVDTPLAVLQGFGKLCFREEGGISDCGTGSTGDILFTTVGHSSGDTYNIKITFRKKP
jgi:hypothetical protein